MQLGGKQNKQQPWTHSFHNGIANYSEGLKIYLRESQTQYGTL